MLTDFEILIQAGISMEYSFKWEEGRLQMVATSPPCAIVRNEDGSITVFSRPGGKK